ELSFRQAHDVVNDLGLAAAAELGRLPGGQAAAKRVLERALVYNRDFVERRGHDPNLRLELADTHFNLGQITSIIGPRSDAVRDFTAAAGLYRELLADDPDSRKLLFDLAVTV